MTIQDALNTASLRLKNLCENPSKVARILLGFHLNTSFERIFLDAKKDLNDPQAFFKLVKRYENYEPLEYITQKAEFYSRDFEMSKGVLIARSETEILVDKVSEILKNEKLQKVCEIGVGSGIISINLLLNFKSLQITATDINPKAIELSRKNAIKFGVGDRLKLLLCNLLDGIDENFELIVSNPPYIAKDYKLDNFVLNEPHEALFGGKNGDEILKQIIKLASQRGVKFLACEMGYDQKQSMQTELEKHGFKAEFYKDLAGFDRGFVARNLKI